MNDLAGKLAEIQETNDVIAALANEVFGFGYHNEELIRILTEHEFSIAEDVWTEYDLAIKVDECLLPFDYKAVDAAGATGYIDWETVGREMLISGWTITGKGFAVLLYK